MVVQAPWHMIVLYLLEFEIGTVIGWFTTYVYEPVTDILLVSCLASPAGQPSKTNKNQNSLSLKVGRALDKIIGAAVVVPWSSVGQSISSKALSSYPSHSVVRRGRVGFCHPMWCGSIQDRQSHSGFDLKMEKGHSLLI